MVILYYLLVETNQPLDIEFEFIVCPETQYIDSKLGSPVGTKSE